MLLVCLFIDFYIGLSYARQQSVMTVDCLLTWRSIISSSV